MKRSIDVFCSLVLIIIFIPLFGIISAVIIFSSGFPVFHWSKRVGQNNDIFNMPKFRTMRTDTPRVATHLLENPYSYMTFSGPFLRKTSLDEIPQLWSILVGNMSLVGPRPALFNQYDLVELRTQYGIDILTPGLTGWAQINGRDSISINEKVQLDVYYLENISLKLDLKIILMTIFYAIGRVNVSH